MVGTGNPHLMSSGISSTTTLTNGFPGNEISPNEDGHRRQNHTTGRHIASSQTNGVSPNQAPTTASTSLGANASARERPRRQPLTRANTDYGPRRALSVAQSESTLEIPQDSEELRHGWEDQYQSSEYLNVLNSVSACSSFIDMNCQ